MSAYDLIWGFLHDQGYMPHGMCLLWNPAVFWTHAVSDAVIALSYFSIPLALGTFTAKRPDLEYRWVIFMFSAFVGACGITHLFGVWVLWVPSYGWEAIAKLLTAAISAFTAIALWWLIPHALTLPGRTQLESQNRTLADEIIRRQEAETQLRKLNRNLERLVRERTEQLERTNADLSRAMEEAQAANRAKSEFLAVMSHEVRTPLNAVLGMNRLLKRSVLTETQERYVDSINSAGQMLLSLLNDILDFSKIEAGRLELEETDFDVHQCVREVVTLFDNEASNKNLDLRLSIARHVPQAIKADAVRVRQILYNLVSNAVKFTEVGSVHVRLDVLSQGDADSNREWLLRITVEDTGPGIPAEKQEGLFKKFVQLDASISRRYGGTGLGLAICKRLVGLMGGQLGCKSTAGKGSVFYVDLPCRPGVLTEATVNAVELDAVPAPARLLVAEDAELNRLLLRELLTPYGHEISFVGTGDQAVAAASQIRFDAILMDVYMPEMDGLEATRQIRSLGDSTLRDTPIIGLTAGVLDEQMRTCRRAGMDWCLPKPIDLQRLLATLARHSRAGSLTRSPNHATEPTPTAPSDLLAVPNTPLFDRGKAKELTDALGRDKMLSMYREFIGICNDLVVRMERSDGKLSHLTHSLAGMAGNFGASRLGDLANLVHRKAIKGMADHHDVRQLRVVLGETDTAIRAYLAA